MNLIEEIEAAGSSDPGFGGTWLGGYHLQQDPPEFAKLVQCLLDNTPAHRPIFYLGVGTASGGTERFIMERLTPGVMTIIDDGQHKDFKVWQEFNKLALLSNHVDVVEHIGNSHSPKAEEFLKFRNQKYDIIGIDGDHSACGTRMDWLLVEPYIKPGTLVWLHDINVKRVHDQGPLELWNYLKSKFTVVLETYEAFGIGVVKV